MKDILNDLFEYKTLSKERAKEVLTNISRGAYNTSQVASFLTVYVLRSITVNELAGFRDALLELCLPVDLSSFETVDLCGTGGDSKNTFNISTVSAFVVAGSGVKVAKHGNYGVSSIYGSSNVLEHLGTKFTNSQDKLQHQLEKAGICLMHAPLFHPAMKQVAPIRKELGIKTFFNMLGPLVNPSRPQSQLVGVFSLELARLYSYFFQTTNAKFKIVHTLGGYDEVSLTDDFKLIDNQGERMISPDNVGFQKTNESELYGGESVADAAKIFIEVLENRATSAQRAVVLTNSALAIQCAKPDLDFAAALEQARHSLESGNAFSCFKKFISLQ